MKTLKKVLCLVLALVMVVGTMAISAAAFEDDDEITNKDAAAVLNGIKVITGYENGEFDPDGKLTRDQGAAIITRLLQASDLKLSTKFADVKGLWSESVVAYCENEGIVAGYGDGLYHPADSLTAVQFAKMVLVALGYDAKIEGLEGETFYNNTVKLATKLGINVKAAAWDQPITRENAAQMAFNALTVEKVSYTGGSTIEINGATISSGATLVGARKNLAQDFKLDLDQDGKLATEPGEEKDGTPNYTYTADGEDVATVAVEPNYTYTVKTVANDADEDGYTKIAAAINKDLGLKGKNALVIKGDDDYDVFVNGVEIDNDTNYELKVGDTVKIFTYKEDNKKVVSRVVVLRAAFAKVDEIKTLTEAEIKKVLKANEDDKHTVEYTLSGNVKFNDVTFPGFDYEKGQYINYVAVDGKVVSSEAATLVAGKVDAIKSSTYRIAGTYYASVLGNAPTIGTEGTWALDAEGNLAGVVTAKTTKVDDYLFIYNIVRAGGAGNVNDDGIAGHDSYTYTVYGVDATGAKMSAAIKVGTDGKFNNEVITDKFNNSNVYRYNKAVAYKMADGYLSVAEGNLSTGVANITVDKTSSKLADGFYANDSTKFVFVAVGETKVTVEVVTGYKKVSVANANSAYLYNASTKAVSTVFVTGSNGDVSGEATTYTYAYLANVLVPVQTKDANGNDVYTYTFKNVDGTEVDVKGNASLKYIDAEQNELDAVAANSLIKYTTKDGKFYEVVKVDFSEPVAVTQADADQMNTASAHYSVANAKVYEINTADKTVAEGTLKAGQNVVVVDANNDNALEYVFIITTTSANA